MEADHYIGVFALRANKGLRVRLATIQISQHLLLVVVALCAIASDLPSTPQVFRRIQVDLDIEAVAHRLCVVREQSFDYDYVARLDELGSFECSVTVTVNRLGDRLSPAKSLKCCSMIPM